MFYLLLTPVANSDFTLVAKKTNWCDEDESVSNYILSHRYLMPLTLQRRGEESSPALPRRGATRQVQGF